MTAERRTTAIAATHSHLDWFAIPHTLDQVIGVCAAATREAQRPIGHGLSNDEILSRLASRTDSGGGKGGHSDPTAQAALYGYTDAVDDADETLGHMDADLARITEACAELDRWVCHTMGVQPLTSALTSRQDRLNAAVSQLHHLRPHLEPALDLDPGAEGHVDWMIHSELADSAAGLRVKCEEIWRASRGDHLPVAVQRELKECTRCGPWRSGTIAVSSGLCQQCKDFRGHHQCLPTQAIVRRWDVGQGATPGQILEAQAGARRKARAS